LKAFFSFIVIQENPMKLTVILEPSEEGGFTALVPALPGCISEGRSRDEALSNIREAINLYLEPVEDDMPLPPEVERLEMVI
jgi:predicted RNase H-like HicB family nuclease